MAFKPLFCGKSGSFFCFFLNKIPLLLGIFTKKKQKKTLGDSPKILLCCWASLGDVVLASSVIEQLLAAWPKAVLGFLYAKESSIILDKENKLTYRHIATPWLNPKQGKLRNFFSFFYCSFFIYPQVIREMKTISYDVCIELNPFFPNSLPLTWSAKIPQRIAFRSGGFDAFMTDLVPFPTPYRYLPLLYPSLLQVLGIKPYTPKITLPFLPKKEHGHIVLHIGTSDTKKEWPVDNWIELSHLLRKQGHKLFFTGQGAKEDALIAQIAREDLQESLSSCLDFYAFANVIEGAQAVISIDSVSLHLAASFQVPFIALYLYNKTLNLWLPEQDNCRLLIGKDCLLDESSPLPAQAHFLLDASPKEVFSHFLSLQGLLP